MNRSFVESLLKDKGISEEDIKSISDSIMDENGKDITKEKTKTEALKNDLKVKEGLVDQLNEKIKENDKVDIEALKKEQFELGKTEGAKEVEEFKKNKALENSIKGAKDFDLVVSKLDMSKIQYEKDDKGEYSVKGIDEQLKSVKESYSYLFNDEKADKTIDIDLGGSHQGSSDKDDLSMLKEAMGIENEQK